jgi:hypothetical protein
MRCPGLLVLLISIATFAQQQNYQAQTSAAQGTLINFNVGRTAT